MLNLHATFTKGTVEFRLFQFDAPSDGTQNGLHAGQLKSYIQLCLAFGGLKVVEGCFLRKGYDNNETVLLSLRQ